MSGTDALNFLDQIQKKIDFACEKIDKELFDRMRNRFEYQINQAEPVKLKYHKAKHGRAHDSWTCQNCGCGISHGVIQNYCWNCGHALAWDSPRCLTGYKNDDLD